MSVEFMVGDCRTVLTSLPAQSVNCCVTSPPYFGLRDYGVDGQIGLEQTPQAYVDELVAVFREVKRVLRDDGTLWLNLGDSYASAWAMPGGRRNVAGQGSLASGKRADRPNRLRDGLKEKDLMGIPWRVAFALQADGWYLRQDIIWHKPNPMPESVRDRCTKAHEYVFLLSKSPQYLFDAEAIAEQAFGRSFNGSPSYAHGDRNDAGRRNTSQVDTKNRRSVWTITTQPFAEAHFATMAPELARTCIMAGCPLGGTVLDPFGGAGTTGLVAHRLQRNAVLIDLNEKYMAMARKRIESDAGLFV